MKEPSGQRLPRSPRSKAATRWPSSSTKLDQYIARNCSRSPTHASVLKASESPQIVRIIAGHGCVITSRPFLLPPPNSLAIGSAVTNLCGGSGLSGSQTCACTHGIGRMCASRRSGASALPYGCDRQMAPCSVLQYELMKLGQSTRDAMQWSSGLRGSPHLMVRKTSTSSAATPKWARGAARALLSLLNF